MFDLLFNFLLLIFWVRLFPWGRETTYFNPWIAWMNQVSRTVLHRMRIWLPPLSQKQAAALVFFLLLVVRAVVRQTVAMPASRFGFESALPVGGLPRQFVLSVTSFAGMIFYLWVACLLLVRRRGRGDPLSQFLRFVAPPLPQGHLPRRWLAVLALGMSVSAVLVLLSLAGSPQAGWTAAVWLRFLGRSAVNAAAAVVDFLPIMQASLIAAIIGSWIAMLAPSAGLAALCSEAMDLLLGPLRNYRLVIGPLDLTPLLAVVAMSVIHTFLRSMLVPLHVAVRTAGAG